jgi:adenine deaminase
MMHKQGVLTAINSDDAEMARRLNQEAAKTAMYTDFKDDESLWKFVTLNPAKMMHIDNKVGSIKVGKDADLVLWSHPPLSIYAKAEQTYVDGIKFFDRNTDITLRDTVRIERARLIQKSLEAKKGGAATQAVPMRTPRMYDCEDIGDELKEEAEGHRD